MNLKAISFPAKLCLALAPLVLLVQVAVAAPKAKTEGAPLKAAQTPPKRGMPKVGQTAIKFSLPQLADPGKEVRLSEIDRPVLLQFWTTTCAVCMVEFPKVQAWAQEHPEVLYLPILSQEDGAERALALLKRLGITTTGIMDHHIIVSDNYGVCKDKDLCEVPAFFAIGKDKKILARMTTKDPQVAVETFLESAFH